MHVEVSVALNFVISYLYNKLPRRRVDMFGEELEKGLKRKFNGHWYPEKPFKGSAFRCIRVSVEKVDPVIVMAAQLSGINMEEVKDYLPTDLTIWIDPGEVSYRIGEKGAVRGLYCNKKEIDEVSSDVDQEVQITNRGFNPEAQSFKPIDSLSSSLNNLSLSPSPQGWASSTPPSAGVNRSTSPINFYLHRTNNNQTFTAAMFAQTKFGSTKLKSHGKRPSRLSPTEFGVYLKHRQPLQPQSGLNNWGGVPQQQNRPRTGDFRDPRQDYLERQQRTIFLQQQQQTRQLPDSALLSPVGGSLNDLYNITNQPGNFTYTDLSSATTGIGQPVNFLKGTLSPDGNKNFLDALKWNTLSPYASLQHLLVAN